MGIVKIFISGSPGDVAEVVKLMLEDNAIKVKPELVHSSCYPSADDSRLRHFLELKFEESDGDRTV